MTPSKKSPAPSGSPTVGDLITVRPLRPVVQLADLEESTLRDSLVEDFVVTGEVEKALGVVLDSIRSNRGSGFFLQGSFGSGKSHFLLVLARVLSDADTAAKMARKVGGEAPGGRSLVIPISLVEHRAEGRLEDAVARAVAARVRDELGLKLWPSPSAEMLAEMRQRIRRDYRHELREFLESPDGRGLDEHTFFTGSPAPLALFVDRYRLPYRLRFDRTELWEEISRALAQDGLRLVLLVDELSEFLRSKPDARSFNEDIRFLQFLGEAGERMRLWVVASLQEWIEETGEIRQEVFNKIKDRYPARLVLSGAHLGELVKRRIAPKKEGAAEVIGRLHRELRGALPGFDVGREEFHDLYPVHPATFQLLDDLRALFSQHRGAMDFLSARIAGDERRKVRGILTEPAGTLVTADQILEHFEDRIRETVEYQPYLDVVYRYWRQEIERVIPDVSEQTVALRALAVLILAGLAPVERPYSVKRLTVLLLHRITSIDARANAEHLREILLRMTREGAYLEHEPAEDILDDIFRVRLQADVNVLISKKLKAAEKDALAEGAAALRRVSGLLTDPALPMASWRELEPTEVEIRWQNTRRRGYFIFGDPIDLGQERFRELFSSLRDGEPDFLVMLVAPWAASGAREWVEERLAPLLDDSTGLAVRLWIPAPARELSSLQSALGRALLLERVRSDAGPVAESMAERLGSQLEAAGGQVRELVRGLYLNGRIVCARGTDELHPGNMGLQEFNALLERIAGRGLAARFPAHESIAPRGEVPILPRLDSLLDSFFRQGLLPRTALRIDQLVVQSYLMPLGLARQSRDGLILHAEPQRSPVLRDLMESLGEGPEPLEAVSHRLRKGRYGMALDPLRLLLLAGAYSGQLRLFGDKAPLRLEELRAAHVTRIRAVSRGEVLGEREQEEVRDIFFLDEKLRSRKPFSNSLQEQLWAGMKEFRRGTEAELSELEGLLGRKGEFPALKEAGFDAAGLRERSQRVGQLLREIKVSYPSREGLEGFLRAAREEPYFAEQYFELQDALGFLRGPVDEFLRSAAYAAEASTALGDATGLWEPAARALEDLRAALSSSPPHRPENLSRRQAALEGFLGTYLPLYREAHDRSRSPMRFRPYRALLENRTFRLLRALAGIERLSAGNELVALNRRLDAVLRRECADFSVEALRVKPVCRCGFRPVDAEAEELAPTSRFLSEAEAALSRVLGELEAPGMRERLTAHVNALRSVGNHDAAQALTSLMEVTERGLQGEEDAKALEEQLDRSMLRLIQDALGGRVLSVERSLASLAERIAGRSLSREKLLAAVEDWIRGDDAPGADVLIRITGDIAAAGTPREGAPREGSVPALASWLEEHRPELSGKLSSGSLKPAALPLLLWAEELGIPQVRLDGLPRIELPAAPERGELTALAREVRAGSAQAFSECVHQAERTLLDVEDWAGLARRLELPAGSRAAADLIQQSGIFGGFQSWLAGEIAHSLHEGGPIPGCLASLPPDAFAAAAPLRELAALEKVRRKLARSGTPEDAQGFEESLRGDLGDLLYHLTLFEGGCAERGVDLGVHRATRVVGDELARWEAAFAGVLTRGDSLKVLRIESLASRWAQGIVAAFKPPEVLWVLVDGMRQDVWRHLKESFLPDVRGHFRVLEETFTWARLPTTTETQLQWLSNPLGRGELVSMESVIPREEYLRRRSTGGSGAAAGCIVKLDFIDHKVHTFRESLYEFFREARIGAEIHLQGLLEALPEGAIVIVFADHGFREDPSFDPRRRYESTRYTHGGGHFLEVMAPAAALLKISGR